MRISPEKSNSIWWGPPKKFSAAFEERKISWLELFYDLVYVIVISQATHHLAGHYGAIGMADYFLLFVIIFWGWINGSMYYDMHGTTGIRTRFMTLWQMMAVATLAVALNRSNSLFFPATVYALVFLQLYITYLWWSVGIYDKEHRKYNMPYTVCYLASIIFIFGTLWIHAPYQRIFLGIAIILNYLPPFLSGINIKKQRVDLSLSSSMVERLGLLMIILFGESILGVITGMNKVSELNLHTWIYFGLGILVVFALWWLFFALIADRPIQKGILKWQLLPLLYIPALASLGITGAIFSDIPSTLSNSNFLPNEVLTRELFGISISVFLASICVISYLLYYPDEYMQSKLLLRPMMFISALLVILITLIFNTIEWVNYLLIIFGILFILIVLLTRMWIKVERGRLEKRH